jgi:hypothetical protein
VFVRAVPRDGVRIEISVDGQPVFAQAGDSILAAMLTNGDVLRHVEFGGEPRAGFCLMGACQDCWVWTNDRGRARACTTLATPGLRISTTPPDWADLQARGGADDA